MVKLYSRNIKRRNWTVTHRQVWRSAATEKQTDNHEPRKHKPFLRDKEEWAGENKGYLPQWKHWQYQAEGYTHAMTRSTMEPKGKTLGSSTTIWPPTSSYRPPHSAVNEHEGLEQHRSCYQQCNRKIWTRRVCKATKPEDEGEMEN